MITEKQNFMSSKKNNNKAALSKAHKTSEEILLGNILGALFSYQVGKTH